LLLLDNFVFTGGQVGKVLVRNLLNSAEAYELIDQAQAHKRKIVGITRSKDFIYTCSLDQKAKQWSIKGFQLVASFSLEWIPTGIWIENGTLFVGGASALASFRLENFDLDIVGSSSAYTSLKKVQGGISINSQSSVDSIIIASIIIGCCTVLLCLSVFIYRSLHANQFKSVEASTSNSGPVTESSVTNATNTLVTSILKISFPGYKELTSIDFRTSQLLAEGGGGVVFVGDALSKKCSVFGKQVILKQIAGELMSYVNFRKLESIKFTTTDFFFSRSFFNGVFL
jgi:hypothetical protein